MEKEKSKISLTGTTEEFKVLLQALELFGFASNSLFYAENIETCNDFMHQIYNQFEIRSKEND